MILAASAVSDEPYLAGSRAEELGTDESQRGQEELAEVWAAYKATGDVALRNELIDHHHRIVHQVAERMQRTVPRSVDFDTLLSAGWTGLMDAVDGFEPSRGFRFKTYCTWRVQGAILDEMRRQDWVPRSIRRNTTLAERARAKLEAELRRAPTDGEVAACMGVEVEVVEKLRHGPRVVHSLDESARMDSGEGEAPQVGDARAADGMRALESRDIIESLASRLNRKERAILTMYYVEGKTMREIGEFLDLTESRVCQIHGNLLVRLRERIAGRRNELAP